MTFSFDKQICIGGIPVPGLIFGYLDVAARIRSCKDTYLGLRGVEGKVIMLSDLYETL